jgi:pyridoxamine 5'-phosphate oxidase
MARTDLGSIRTDYANAGLEERDLDPSPFRQIEKWLNEAIAAEHPEPTAMSVATITRDGFPAARVVLLKGVDDRGLVFFTNYESDKGKEVAENPNACANIFWVLLSRQIRVTGKIEKVPREESEAYFASRPRESKLGAWASAQSSVLAGRAELEAQLTAVRERFGEGLVPCPPHWGGYCLRPTRVEFWQGRPSRLHDRLRYMQVDASRWTISRLAP